MYYKKLVVIFCILICVVLAIVVNVFLGIDIVYTHFFYIPIILTGIWYPRYAVALAAIFGVIHIACDYLTMDAFKMGSILRASIFIIVAYVTSYIALKRDRLFSELQMLNNAMLDMISKVDGNGVVEYVSPSVTSVLGYSAEQIIGKPLFDFIHPDEAATLNQKFKTAIETKTSFRMDYRCRCSNGSYIWIESLANPVEGNDLGMNIYVFGSRDITMRKQAEEKLKHLSIHDSLTGLHNRFLYEEELRRFNTGRFDPIGIVMCDLDGLKLVNDNLGHDIGDRLLITAAKLLKEQFRASDIVARIGGDEFAVLLPDCPVEMTKEICDRFKRSMMNTYIPGTQLPLMMSIGYATREGKGFSVEEIVKEADVNMYKEKVQNRQAFQEIFKSVVPMQ